MATTPRRIGLRNRCAVYAQKYGYNEDDLGRGLEYFAAHLFAQQEGFDFAVLDGDPTEDVDLSDYVCGGKGDLGIDALLSDPANRQVCIIQTTWVSKYRDDLVEKAARFFNRLAGWTNPREVDEGNEKVRGLLVDADLTPETQAISLNFVVSIPIGEHEDFRREAAAAQESYEARGWNVECRVFGAAEIESLHQELSNARTGSIVPEVTFNISETSQFMFGGDPRVLVCAIKGNEIAGIYHRTGVKNRLFSTNIRLALTSGKINPAIQHTAQDAEEGGHFFYFNNGITATCSSFAVNGAEVKATNMQVVNGAQTVNALQRALRLMPNPSVYVLLRLIETGEEYRNKSNFAENVTKYQNTQNPVRLSDFFSNDPIQLWLRDNLAQLSGRGPVPPFYYVHKRGYKPSRAAGKAITLEELALLRHAVLHGPTTSYADSKSYWDKTSDNGRYWEAFGSAGRPCDSWGSIDLSIAGWSIATWMKLRKIHADLRAAARANPEARVSSEAGYLGYLARYVTALAYVGLEQAIRMDYVDSVDTIIATKSSYQRCEPIILKARELVQDEMRLRSRTTQANPRLNMARDTDTWSALREAIVDKLASGYVELGTGSRPF